MTQRAVRPGAYKETRKLSKYEAQLESAYKQKRVYTTSTDEVTTLTYIPETVIVTDSGSADATAITLPTGFFDEDKEVTVINKDSSETCLVGAVQVPAGSIGVISFNGTAWTLLYSYTATSIA